MFACPRERILISAANWSAERRSQMGATQVVLEPGRTRSLNRGRFFRTAVLIALALLVGFAAGAVLAGTQTKTPAAVADTPKPMAESQAVVLATQPDGSVGCSNLATGAPDGKEMVMYHWNDGRLDSTECKPAGGFIGLGSMP